MKIEILGTGCPKCTTTEKNVKDALAELGITADVRKVTNINDIMEYDVMVTPALVVDGEVKVSGKVPSVGEIKRLIG